MVHCQYCGKDTETFLEGLKKVSECTYENDKLFVHYKGKENVFVQYASLIERNKYQSNVLDNKKRGRVIFMQHGLSGFGAVFTKNSTSSTAPLQYDEFEVMVKKLTNNMKGKNGFGYKSLGIITKRVKTIEELKAKKITYLSNYKKDTYIFFNNAIEHKRAEKNGISKLIEEFTKYNNVLIRTEFSTGQESFET